MTEYQTLTVAAPGLLANDSDPTNLPISAVSFTAPLHGTLTPDANGDGGFVYTPYFGYYGTDSFTYMAADSAGTSTPVTVTITVNALPPFAQGGSYSVTENQNLTVNAPGLLADDFDPNGLPLSAILVTSPAHGTLTPDSNGDGGFVYTPANGFYGTDSFTYEATDGVATSNAATVTITVSPLPPSLTGPESVSVNEDGTLDFNGGNVIAVQDNSGAFEQLTVKVLDGTLTLTTTSGLTSVIGSGTSSITATGPLDSLNADLADPLVYTPTPGFSGTDTMTVVIFDTSDQEQAPSEQIPITVNPPVLNVPASVNVDENTSVTFSNAYAISVVDTAGNGNNNETISLSVGDGTLSLGTSSNLTVSGTGTTISPLVLSGSLSALNGDLSTLVYTPTFGYSGPDALNLSILDTTDGDQGSPANVPITVTPTLEVTSFTPTSTGFVADFNSPLNVSVLNLYDQGGLFGLPDVVVTGEASGTIDGSLVVDPTGQQITFIKTGGGLAPDDYTVTLVSGANAFSSTSGQLLDGGDNFTQSFVVAPPAANTVIVSLPDFARGYGQPVNLPANVPTAGLPLTLSNGSGLSGLDLELDYNPASSISPTSL